VCVCESKCAQAFRVRVCVCMYACTRVCVFLCVCACEYTCEAVCAHTLPVDSDSSK
jgi:hypothetical protein